MNTVVLGASFDTVEDNKKFAEKYDFPFLLLSDTERDVGVKYHAGRNKEEKMARRISYLIDPEGTIAKVYGKVNPAEHPNQVIEDLEALQGKG